MRIDNCRNCGEKLIAIEYCEKCSQPLKLQCKNRLHFADDPIHLQCDLIIRSQIPRISA